MFCARPLPLGILHRWSLRYDRGPRRSNRGERKYSEEGIEHENDREESKEETVENETVDAVVNTRGGKMM